MKPITILSLGVTLVLSMTSCNKFLDENPYSSLVDPDNASKIEKLLGSAYSTSSIAYLTELSSDNIQDDGVNNPYTNQFCEKAAYWETIVNSDGLYDAPYLIWQNTYNAIAHANEALEDIEALGGDKEELQGIKGRLSWLVPMDTSVWQTSSACPTTPRPAPRILAFPTSRSA